MRIRLHSCPLVIFLLVGLFASATLAQQTCPAPPMPQRGKEQSIFSEEQEMFLGDAIAEQTERDNRIIVDTEITAYLTRIGNRLVAHLPPSPMRFQFYLVDKAEANAYAAPGGRIYVTRKLVASVRSEDELAGVLAHEIGHVVARDSAVFLSQLLKEVLKVNQVSDRADIIQKYHDLMDNVARRPEALERAGKRRGSEQLGADELSIYLAARAGYNPQAFVDWWDHFTEVQGKTGNWFSDVFGTTKPESRRLREMLHTVSALPKDCLQHNPSSEEEFRQWRSAVVAYTGLGLREAVHGVLSRTQLDPPLRGDITHLKFSPDGNFILAQDDAGIQVLSRAPLTPLFRISAVEAFPAHFTPDSKSVVFHNAGLRVEWWDVASEQRTGIHELVTARGCFESFLSPDGKSLACFGTEFDLRLFDVASGKMVFQKKEFYIPNLLEYVAWLINLRLGESDFQPIRMGFTPDGHYFVAARRDTAIAIDATTNTPIPLPSKIKKYLVGGFVFLGPDRLVGVNYENPAKSAAVQFPSGEILTELTLGSQMVDAPAAGDYVLLRPIDKFALGVLNLATRKIFMANRTSAFDIYNRWFVSERVSGELGLYSADAADPIATVNLPRAPLGRLRAAALSPEMDWLAISERTRGGVWSLKKGERAFYVRGFRGAYFDGQSLYADFPKFQNTERIIGKLDLNTRQAQNGFPVDEPSTQQIGAYLVLLKPAKKDGPTNENVTLEVKDTRTGELLWSRPFPKEAPRIDYESNQGVLVLRWPLDTTSARAEVKNDPEMQKRWGDMKEKEGDYFLEIVNARDGKVFGRLMLETGKGSFQVRSAVVAGDSVVINDNQNRILVYSLSTHEQRGRIFGASASVAGSRGLLCVENVPGQLILYDLASLEKRDQFTFPSPVAMTQFSVDGTRLFVLTANQTAYLLDVSAIGRQTNASARP